VEVCIRQTPAVRDPLLKSFQDKEKMAQLPSGILGTRLGLGNMQSGDATKRACPVAGFSRDDWTHVIAGYGCPG
jgi:hypothetical protein